MNFIGNVEGRDIPNGVCDVVVCDGFTGNLILKTYEGVALVMMNQIKNMFMGAVKGKLAKRSCYEGPKKYENAF